MVGQIIDREVSNFAVHRARRGRSSRDIALFAAGILLVLLIVLGYIYIPNRIREIDYKIEQAKKNLLQLEQEMEVLQMKESKLTSPFRLEEEAHILGLEKIHMNQIRYIRSTIDSQTLAVMSLPKNPREGG